MCESISLVLRNLNWLAVHWRIGYKMLSMTFKKWNKESPVYKSAGNLSIPPKKTYEVFPEAATTS